VNRKRFPRAGAEDPGMVDRREFLGDGRRLRGNAIAHLLGADRCFAETSPVSADFKADSNHEPGSPRDSRSFLSGAARQCDMFDYKAGLIQRNGQKFDPGRESGTVPKLENGMSMKVRGTGKLMANAGTLISDLVPHLGGRWRDESRLSIDGSKSKLRPRKRICKNPGLCYGVSATWRLDLYGLGRLRTNLPNL